MKPSSKSFAHLAHEVIENIDDLYPKHKGPLDIETVSKKTPQESKKILGHNYLKVEGE
jgi:hypothetical protein